MEAFVGLVYHPIETKLIFLLEFCLKKALCLKDVGYLL